jgi:hypothetical protein
VWSLLLPVLCCVLFLLDIVAVDGARHRCPARLFNDVKAEQQ